MSQSLDYIRKLAKLMLEIDTGDHFQALGLRFERIEQGFACMVMPYSESQVGNPETGVVHGGVLTALLDSCCGFAASTSLDDVGLCPTLDLRIDYMGSAIPGKPIYAEAKTYRVTKQVIFCRGQAFQEGDRERPVAYCVANFARLDPEVLKAMADQMRPHLDKVDLGSET